MSVTKIAISTISFIADVFALKVLSAIPESARALLSRITGGVIGTTACAARARMHAQDLDAAFPVLTRLLGQRPSRLIEELIGAVANSAVSRARDVTSVIDNYIAPHGQALNALLPSAKAVGPEAAVHAK